MKNYEPPVSTKNLVVLTTKTRANLSIVLIICFSSGFRRAGAHKLDAKHGRTDFGKYFSSKNSVVREIFFGHGGFN